MAFLQLISLLLLASATSAQVQRNCPVLDSDTYTWNPDVNPTLTVQTSYGSYYTANMKCFFDITATRTGRIMVSVLINDIFSYDASISIRTAILTGYLADWNRLTYSEDRHKNFISTRNQLFISFTTSNSQPGFSSGVRLQLTFLRPTDCPPRFAPVSLAGQLHCVGSPIQKSFKFGDAQRYCNLQRSNLLVSDKNNVSSTLMAVSAANVWIGMTAEPSGSYSSYRWLNNVGVSASQPVVCSGGCKPGSTTHRCVYAASWNLLMQDSCSQSLVPLCFMPAGGTDTFFAGSAAARASGALLSAAMVLCWSLLR